MATQVRNKAHTLPYFLSLLEQLRFPKNRIILHIRSDLNEVPVIHVNYAFHNMVMVKYQSLNYKDTSLQILQTWIGRVAKEKLYHDIITDFGLITSLSKFKKHPENLILKHQL